MNTHTITFILVLMLVITGCGSDGPADPGSGNGDLFRSGDVSPGESFSFTFEEAGTVEYFCDIHDPDMQGEVLVSSGAEISGRDTVNMENTQFNPGRITIAPNTTIVWVNRDNFAHTVINGNPVTNSGGGY